MSLNGTQDESRPKRHHMAIITGYMETINDENGPNNKCFFFFSFEFYYYY